MDKLASELANIKELVKNLKTEREDLIFERDRLKAIAGADAEALTVRPDYKQMLSEKQLEFGIKTDLLTKGCLCFHLNNIY